MDAVTLRSVAIAGAILMATPANAETAMESALSEGFKTGDLAGLHAVHVSRDGDTLAEAYFTGADERWGQPLGEVVHGPETLHDLRSVTKSVVGLLYGIALDEGLVPDPDEPLIAQFSQYAGLAEDADRAAIRIRHALSMKMGTQWSEDLPYTDPRNSEIAMELAEDRYRYVLDRPMVSEPGDWWVYNGGASAIIAKLIEDGAGMPLDAYAEKVLFTPLGIDRFEWIAGQDGVPSAASGLRLRARDLAKIGQLVAQDGVWRGKQLVSETWIAEMLAPRATLQSTLRYGYFWWLQPGKGSPQWVAGFGNGGQRLNVGLVTGTVVVVFAGRYNDPQAWELPLKTIVDYVGPALTKE